MIWAEKWVQLLKQCVCLHFVVLMQKVQPSCILYSLQMKQNSSSFLCFDFKWFGLTAHEIEIMNDWIGAVWHGGNQLLALGEMLLELSLLPKQQPSAHLVIFQGFRCFSSSSWQHYTDSVWGSGHVSWLANQAHGQQRFGNSLVGVTVNVVSMNLAIRWKHEVL